MTANDVMVAGVDLAMATDIRDQVSEVKSSLAATSARLTTQHEHLIESIARLEATLHEAGKNSVAFRENVSQKLNDVVDSVRKVEIEVERVKEDLQERANNDFFPWLRRNAAPIAVTITVLTVLIAFAKWVMAHIRW
jgi:hypothetical protein